MVKALRLTDFRNFKSKHVEFSDKISVIVGPNASGKTNILESLFLLSTGKSFKAKLEREMIYYEYNLARVEGNLSLISQKSTPEGILALGLPASHNSSKLEAILTLGDNGWPRKRLLVNGVPKRLVDFAGNFKIVLFGPWDMDLVTESPSIRRKFLDTVLSQVDREYRRSIHSYEKGLRQRNRLLYRIREEGISRTQLTFWNQLLIKSGNYITEKREEFIDFVNHQPSLNDQKFQIEYDRSVISEGRLEQYSGEEIAAATTLVGPHRDDFVFLKNNKGRELAAYGSRGEQRMGILWLKM
jgi:DNA replication and repair protein RecF